MFSTVEQFSNLSRHNVEGMEGLLANFSAVLDDFKRKPYDLLDYHKSHFDRDYLEFNANIHELESSLQGFINASFENIMSTEHALNLLKQLLEPHTQAAADPTERQLSSAVPTEKIFSRTASAPLASVTLWFRSCARASVRTLPTSTVVLRYYIWGLQYGGNAPWCAF